MSTSSFSSSTFSTPWSVFSPDSFGQDANQLEWTHFYMPVDEYDSDGDLMPDGAFSESDNGDVANPSDVNEPVEDYDSEIDDPSTFSEFVDDVDDTEMQQLVQQGFEVCRCEHVEGNQSGGSHGRRCALREPDTQVEPRLRYLERSVGAGKVARMQELGVLDSVLDVLPESALIMTAGEDPPVMALEDFVETDILLSLDSGCCERIIDMADASAYAAVLRPSPGS